MAAKTKKQTGEIVIQAASLVSYRIMPARMGGQKGIYLFLKYFSRHCNVTCYTIKDNAPGQDEPFRVKAILGNGKLRYINLLYFFILKKNFRQDGINHLIIEHPYYGWLGALLKWFTGVKLIVHSHNIEALRFRDMGKWWWFILWQYEKFTHRIADKNFFISREDMEFALKNFHLEAEKCSVITYGTEQSDIPDKEEINAAGQKILEKHKIAEKDIILLYNGTLNYKPNLSGLDLILKEINPLIQQHSGHSFSTLICGHKLPESYNHLESYASQKIIYAGFVENIHDYFLACNIFINPIAEGGGIKTKLVEALAANRTCVSFETGAIGIPKGITGNKLFIAEDGNASAFAGAIISAVDTIHEDIPPSFFDHFYWDNIAKKAADFITD